MRLKRCCEEGALMRPRGTYGELAQALCAAAASGPAPVRELCERAQVGYAAGRYTASRLVAGGALVPVQESRPMVLTVPDLQDTAPVLQMLPRSFWEAPEAAAGPGDT